MAVRLHGRGVKSKRGKKQNNNVEDTEGVNRLFVNLLKNVIFSAFWALSEAGGEIRI
jgi:hypothetical protein